MPTFTEPLVAVMIFPFAVMGVVLLARKVPAVSVIEFAPKMFTVEVASLVNASLAVREN